MFYLKLFLIVFAGCIGIWFAINRFIASTDHMTNSFSHDTGIAARAEAEAGAGAGAGAGAEKNGNSLNQASIPSQPGSEISGEVMTVSARISTLVDEQAVPAELVPALEEDAVVKIVVKVDEDTDIDKNKQQVEKQDEESGLSDSERADSDADMQADSDADGEADSESDADTRGKALELDNKLLDTIKPNDTIKKARRETVRALDIAYALPSDSRCVISGDRKYPRVGVHYRPSSFAIKGQSLTNIDKLVAAYKKCGGKLLVLGNKLDSAESDEKLYQLRQDEVKYYLLQRRVPKADMIFSNN